MPDLTHIEPERQEIYNRIKMMAVSEHPSSIAVELLCLIDDLQRARKALDDFPGRSVGEQTWNRWIFQREEALASARAAKGAAASQAPPNGVLESISEPSCVYVAMQDQLRARKQFGEKATIITFANRKAALEMSQKHRRIFWYPYGIEEDLSA